jgi:hypothetical protein
MKYIISSLIYLLLLFSLSTFVFDPSHLYFELPWLDIPMHILGGFGVASLALSVASYKKKKITLQTVLLVFLAVAIAWEVYEVAREQVLGLSWDGLFDTIKDIIDGGIGATVAYYLLKK